MTDEEKQQEEGQNLPTAAAPSSGGPTLGEVEFTEEPSGEEAPVVEDGSGSTASNAAFEVREQEYQAALAEMEQKMQSLRAQLEDRNTQYMRIAADFDNFRKRTQKEKEDLELQTKCTTINELLPVVDNFERARSQIKPQTDQEMNIHKSYQSVYKQLVDCLKRIGVSPMRSEGKEFDPNLHEAVMREPSDQQPEGTVLEELVRGYMLGERVLRHAMVKVAAAPDVEEGQAADEAASAE